MANVIVGIHGLANKPEPQLLSDWWEKSIREGLKNRGVDNADFRFVMVDWAKFLYKNRQHREADFDFDPLYLNQPYIKATRNALKRYDEGLRDRFREWGTNLAGSVIDTIRGPLGLEKIEDRLLEDKARDLDYYYDEKRQLTDPNGQKRTAKKVLKGELMDTLVPLKNDRLMLIAHSMGTIIAYDVLRDLGQNDSEFQVHHFVTIGSPLGIAAVKARISKDRDEEVRTPTVVSEKWRNYADKADPVSVDAHLRDDFGANKRRVRVEDDLVHNDYVDLEGKRKPHKSFGYLRTPELSDQIKDFLKI